MAVAAAFLSVNIHPTHHGMSGGFSLGLLGLSTAILALFIFIIHKAHAQAGPQESGAATHTPDRQRRMLILWSAFAVFLSVPLFRYPLTDTLLRGGTAGLKEIASIAAGAAVVTATAINFAKAMGK